MIEMCDMEIGKLGIIKKIDIEDNFKRRLMDIGVVNGESVVRVLEDYFRGISAYVIMDSLIAIRDNDVRGIKVIYE